MKKIAWAAISILLFVAVFSPHLLHAQESTQAAFQPFERGYMIWRSDTGGIWVLLKDAWQARYFPQSEYENLPDNPVTSPEPVGLFKPVSGFGRVWGNFAEVQDALGWATTPEQGYTANFRPATYTAGGLAQTAVNFPDGRDIVIREDDTWQFDDGMPRSLWSLHSGTAFPATIQAFEHGYMMWWSETGTIWALADSPNRVMLYDSLSYGALPDNPVTEVPPAGLIKPIMGLGKVWGNFVEVRNALGWATGPERSYQVTFERITPPPDSGMFFGKVSHSGFGSFVIWGSEWYIEGPGLPKPTYTPQPPSCTPRADWPIYTVQAGDTLYRIAQRTGSTVDALVQANCLSNPNQLYVGLQLHVPTLPVTPTPAPPPAGSTLTYVNGLGQYAFDYPADWHLQPVQVNGAHITLTSYDPAARNPSASEFATDPNLLRIDFYVQASAHSTLEAWVNDHNAHRDTTYTHIVAEDWWALPTGQQAVRLRLEGTSIESGEYTSWSEFYTLIGTNIIKGLGVGARFDEIAYTVQALVPPPEPTPYPQMTTYTSSAGYAFDHLDNWHIQSEHHVGHGVSETVTLTSYDPANGDPPRAAITPTTLKITFSTYTYAAIDPSGFDTFVAHYKSQVDGVTLQIANEYSVTLPGGIPALRLDMVSGTGGFPVLLTIIGNTQIQAEGLTGDYALFDGVVNTLRATQ